MTPAEPAPTSIPPRPSVLLVVLSVLVMCGAAAVMGLAIGLPFLDNYGPSVCFGVLVTSVSLTLGVNQFLGTFRRWQGSAILVGLALLGLGTLWLVLLSFAVFEDPPSTGDEPDELVALSLVILFCVLLLWAGTLNLLWQIRLNRSAPPNEPIPLSRFSFRELFLLMTVLAAMLASTGYLLRQIPPRWGENVEHTRARYDLPAEAEAICFSRTEGAMAVEFTLKEADFLKWVQEGHPHDERWQAPLVPISTTYEIPRYWQSSRPPAQKPIAKIKRGLYLEDKTPGWSLQVAYDEETNRVYLYETWVQGDYH